MIEISELRIGNILLFDNKPVIVEGVLLDSVIISNDQIHPDDTRLIPLLLSDLLLEFLGKSKVVKDSGTQHVYHRNSSTYMIYHDFEGYFIGMYKSDGPIRITPCHFLYLHQLQNIHFAQYGEEIDVDVKSVRLAWQTLLNLGRV